MDFVRHLSELKLMAKLTFTGASYNGIGVLKILQFENFPITDTDSGWPLNVFLTPDLKPIFGGTYWPGPGTSTPSLGEQMGFLDVLHRIVVL